MRACLPCPRRQAIMHGSLMLADPVRKMPATLGMRTVSGESQNIRGRRLASWVKRRRSGPVLGAQAVKVE
jgi:hypothetical protein